MKNKIILFLIFFTNSLFSQTGIITYKTTSNNKKKPPSERVKKTVEEINRATYTLKYNKNYSFFSRDKIIPLYPLEAKLASIWTSSNKDCYQYNGIIKKSYTNSEISNTMYIVSYEEKTNEWVLDSSVKIIDGFTCYRATKKIFYPRTGVTGENIAWYTPEIPVPYGPAGYGGLPGLILQLQLGKKVIYLAQKIELNPKKKIKINKIKDGKIISVDEHVQLMRGARKYVPEEKDEN